MTLPIASTVAPRGTPAPAADRPRRRLSHALRALLAVVAATALGGCGDEIVDPTGDPAVGTYALQRVNGQALPYSFGQEVWEAMSLTLTADQKVAGSLRWRETDASGATVEQGTDQIAGTYTRSGTQLTITLADDDPAPAVVEGSTLTMTSDGAVLVFRRQ